MKRQRYSILLILAAALLPLAGWSATDANAPAPTATQPAAADSTATLSQPTREVLKMAISGVPDDVLKAYIENSSSTFNLNADGIVNLHGVGVSPTVLSAMMTHDKVFADKALAQANTFLPTPPAETVAQPTPVPVPAYPDVVTYPEVVAPPVNYYQNYYGGLNPYGSWYYLTGYGWCWQSLASFSYPFFAGGGVIFNTGSWFHHPTRGLFWRPGEHFRGGGLPGNQFRTPSSTFGGFRGVPRFAPSPIRPSSFAPRTSSSINSGPRNFGAQNFGARTFSQPIVIHSSISSTRAAGGFNGFSSGGVGAHFGGGFGGGFSGHPGGMGGMSHGRR